MTSKYFTCKNCHENTRVRSMATDRVEMERDLGETFLAACSNCHDRKTIHVNDVHAEPNRIITGVGGVVGVAATVALWQIGYVAVLSATLPVIIHAAQQKAATTFNGYKIRPTK
ncbi:hypothetical protein FUA23_02830 [Neolewinella aurantiaca]|uniref:Uncharacterized protein n=1 Tax=Neolewinella aurantiaca TaxID=2602767 RepID=A0A5C7FSW0_9BACT|nr:hypothetical protein [Neolewinella aurantiaca]TXF91177.1 hypothetical protein FUA23_02830 [Neolewinella aurantiaca]